MFQNDLDPRLLSHLKEIAGQAGILSYRKYIQEVLFAPELGYYRKETERVGRKKETDFYTAESLGGVFSELVLGAVQKILGESNCKTAEFIEIGAENGNGIIRLLENRNHPCIPFLSSKTIKVGQGIEIAKNAVVFANELLDAQAFHRLIFKNGCWRELGVRIDNEGYFEELMPELSSEVKEIISDLPSIAEEGYRLDLPLGAEDLLRNLVEQEWKGMIVLFDYGFLWDDLIHNHPAGTARAYYKHKQYNDLLINVGKQDITCHICWDRLSKILEENGFNQPQLQRQESFFVHHASEVIEKIISKSPNGKMNYDKQTIFELIHPLHMGHKFQVLWATRG